MHGQNFLLPMPMVFPLLHAEGNFAATCNAMALHCKLQAILPPIAIGQYKMPAYTFSNDASHTATGLARFWIINQSGNTLGCYQANL